MGETPRSGYNLRRVFETTPLGAYSSSPGSIYPALRNLEALGLARQEPLGASKKGYVPTEQGRAALEDWLAAPPTSADVADDLGIVLLRFAFLQGRSSPSDVDAFLAAFAEACDAHAAGLDTFLADADGQALSLHSRLAVDHGLRAIRSSGQWARDARASLARAHEGEGDA